MLTAKLIVLGLSVINLGTIKEEDGIQSHSFWVLNQGTEPTSLVQGYTSCGCTTIEFPKDSLIQPGDSVQVTLHFNPRGKGGEFYESGTVIYNTTDSATVPDASPLGSATRHSLQFALQGTCITSEETLLKQHPIKLDNGLRVSVTHYDLGYLKIGEQRQRNVSVIFPDMTKQSVKFTFIADDAKGKGLQHITQTTEVIHNGKKYNIDLTFDVIIK